MDRLLVIQVIILIVGIGLLLGLIHFLITYQADLYVLLGSSLFGVALLGLIFSEFQSIRSRY